MADLHVYVVTRFASQANRRMVQLLSLGNGHARVTLVSQSSGGSYWHSDHLLVRQLPDPLAAFGRIGAPGLREALARRVYFPSSAVRYTYPAQRTLERAVRADLDAGRRALVITMVPPHDLVLVGLAIKQRWPAVRWLVDWGDLWSYDDNYFGGTARWQRKVRALEARVFEACDLNVVSNPYAAEVLERVYRVPSDRVAAIPHAYDDGDARPTPSSSPHHNGVLAIAHLGNLFKPPRVPGADVLAALGYARSTGLDFRLHIIGDKYLTKVSREPVQGLDWVVVSPPMAHEDSLGLAAHADLLLLALGDLPNSRVVMHAKLPYYLKLGKPILGLVPDESFVAAVLRETGTGWVAWPPASWGRSVARILRSFQTTRAAPRRVEAAIEQFSWARLSQAWTKVLKNVTGELGP